MKRLKFEILTGTRFDLWTDNKIHQIIEKNTTKCCEKEAPHGHTHSVTSIIMFSRLKRLNFKSKFSLFTMVSSFAVKSKCECVCERKNIVSVSGRFEPISSIHINFSLSIQSSVVCILSIQNSVVVRLHSQIFYFGICFYTYVIVYVCMK